MKIGFVTPFLTRSGGGIFTSAQRLAQTLSRENTVRVFGLDDPAATEDLATWAPLAAESFPVSGPRSFGYAPALGRAVQAAPLDVLHAHGLWMYPSLATRQSGKPYIVSPHGMLDPWALALSPWKKRCAALFFQDTQLHRAACLHALCPAEAESIRAYGLTNPICVIPNGIDLPPPVHDPAPWAEEIPSGEKVLLYLGRLHPKKGLPNLLRAWTAVADPGWHLVLAGWDQGGHESELKRLAEEVRAPRVHFPGPLFGPAKSAAYHHAAAFVLPSLSEGLPMVILEAWAHAKPVLMTDACNLPAGLARGAALRITAEVEDLAHGLRTLTALPREEREAMGARGRQLAEEDFSWPKIASDFCAVYDWILHRGPHPACVLPKS